MPLKVLYVDDEPDIREIAAMALELDPDFQVCTAESGTAALDLLQSPFWRPDVILMDFMMPEMDGSTTLAEVRRLARYAQTPVIFVTARTGAADVKRMTDEGACAVITKPFDPMGVAKEVRRLLATMEGQQGNPHGDAPPLLS